MKRKQIKTAGLLLWISMLAGIFSIAPAIDATGYLTEAAANMDQVIISAVFQLVLSFSYIAISILIYPSIQRSGPGLSLGYLSFRIIAATFSLTGTLLLLTILALSRAYTSHSLPQPLTYEILGHMFRASRDYTNHVFMILALCTGNLSGYILFYKSQLIPRWLSVWGITGALLSIGASVLFLFQKTTLLSGSYLALNAPAAIHDLVLGLWFMVKGLDSKLPRHLAD